MSRYVILEHDHPQRHWDFMLECGDVLKTWRLTEPPKPGQSVPAQASFDHRLIYLDYEGPLSGDRGCVARWDTGTYTWEIDERDRVGVRLDGVRCQGSAVLKRDALGDWTLQMARADCVTPLLPE
jgi:hypothetical protein